MSPRSWTGPTRGPRRAIAEKLLEAAERGMWAEPREELIGEIRSRFLALEDDLEGATA